MLSYLNAWNVGKSDDDTVIYTDLAATLTDMTRGITDAITMALVAFATDQGALGEFNYLVLLA